MLILFLVFAAVIVLAVWVFNRLVALRTRAENAWSDIDVQLKRRWDLLPRLVETVRGYAGHEARTLEQVTEARARAQAAGSVAERDRAETDLATGTVRLVALAEQYPALRADELFRSLHDQLVDVEGALQSARRYYNAVVRDMNTLIRVFPANLVARPFRFAPRDFFQLEPGEAGLPSVNLEP